MTSFRMAVTVLAVMHAVFAGFTAMVGAFADGGDVWQRLLVVLLHPLGAAGVLVWRPRLASTTILALAALLTANVIADLGPCAADRSNHYFKDQWEAWYSERHRQLTTSDHLPTPRRPLSRFMHELFEFGRLDQYRLR